MPDFRTTRFSLPFRFSSPRLVLGEVEGHPAGLRSPGQPFVPAARQSPRRACTPWPEGPVPARRESEAAGGRHAPLTGATNEINLYKHGISRTNLNLDDSGQCFRYRNSRFERVNFVAELVKLEAGLAELGETLHSVYDETYIAQKEEALRKAGIPLLRVEIEPEDRSIH